MMASRRSLGVEFSDPSTMIRPTIYTPRTAAVKQMPIRKWVPGSASYALAGQGVVYEFAGVIALLFEGVRSIIA